MSVGVCGRPAGSQGWRRLWTRQSDHDTHTRPQQRAAQSALPAAQNEGRGKGWGGRPAPAGAGEGLPRNGQPRHCAAVPCPEQAQPSQQNAHPEQHSPRLIQAKAPGAASLTEIRQDAALLPARLPAHASPGGSVEGPRAWSLPPEGAAPRLPLWPGSAWACTGVGGWVGMNCGWRALPLSLPSKAK